MKTESLKMNFNEYLQRELAERCEKNPNYSLRAFARDIQMAPSSVSELINNKRAVSEKVKRKIGRSLGMSEDELELFQSNQHGNRKNKLKDDCLDNVEFQEVTLDVFEIIADWYHYAILELMSVDNFRWDYNWISQRLGIQEDKIKEAVERMERVGLLEKDHDGNFHDTTKGFSSDIREGLTSLAQRKFQERALLNSIECLHNTPIRRRDNTSITFAVSESDLEEAKKDIQNFRRSFAAKYSNKNNLTDVYQLTMALCPLTMRSE